MSAGSDASILGYGKYFPNSNINGSFVNVNNSNYPGGFSSNEIPYSSLYASKNNVDAANSCAPGACYKGGRKSLKRKIKNISKMYKMKGLKKHVKTMKRKIMTKYYRNKKNRKTNKRTNKKRTVSRRKYRGGYAQYQNNMPLTPVYEVGSKLDANQSALANPPPIKTLSGCANCSDNYNHFNNSSTPSKGWGAY